VQLSFGEKCDVIAGAIERHHAGSRPPRVLEVGCGPGYLCLELARKGYLVTGLDLSQQAIHYARRFAEEDPWRAERGELVYVCSDFLTLPGASIFDAIVFLGSLHHFRDQAAVMQRTNGLLAEGGLVIAHEPTRDRETIGNTTFLHLVRLLLSLRGGYFESSVIPTTMEAHVSETQRLLREQKYETEDGTKAQSVNDNEAGYRDMVAALDQHFRRLECRDRSAFFQEVIGGLRFDDGTNAELARYLSNADTLLCAQGVLQATEFFYVGRKIEE
jgi:SAM-dependent methyltransferase